MERRQRLAVLAQGLARIARSLAVDAAYERRPGVRKGGYIIVNFEVDDPAIAKLNTSPVMEDDLGWMAEVVFEQNGNFFLTDAYLDGRLWVIDEDAEIEDAKRPRDWKPPQNLTNKLKKRNR